ncbi:DUF968 domain-containing protein [Yokenella regensburgei]|uniref:DUF968 domain-containing protein n=1 Tax=Yokenella regensburgei TaxID=158877 RepID=UPI003EDA17AE
MRALFTPEVVPRLGVVLLKPGKELMRLFANGRVLVEEVPESMSRLPSGRVPDARQPLASDRTLDKFFTDEKVINAAGGIPALEAWLERNVKACQYPYSDYHHMELVTMRHPPGAMMLCWHCENQLREQTTAQLSDMARANVVDWIIDTVLMRLRFNRERELSLAELCWWAVYSGVADAITESMAEKALLLPGEKFLSVYKESDIVPAVPAVSVMKQRTDRVAVTQQSRSCEKQQEELEQQPKVLALRADPESPESFMLRPKRRRWTCEEYTRWVKAQPCECCRRPADDPHHIIGHGMGGTATKAHDLFVFPLCRECHDELHRSVAEFERKHGSQLTLLFRFLDRALAIGVIVKA